MNARGERIVASKITGLAAVRQEHVTPVYQMEAVAQLLKILRPKFEELKVMQMQQNLEGLRLSPRRAERGRGADGGGWPNETEGKSCLRRQHVVART